MTWGQQHIWRMLRRYGVANWHFNISMVIDLPASAGQDRVACALRRLVERNQSLRTHFADEPGPGEHGPGESWQRIARTGTFALHMADVPGQVSRDRADALAVTLAARPFEHDTEWGARIALVRVGGRPRHMVIAVSHVVVDGAGLQAMIDDLNDLLHWQAHQGSQEPAPRWQPADQARREQSVRGIRRNQAALAYWRRCLTRIPPSMFPVPAGVPQTPRFRRLRLHSRALAAASARLARDCQVSVSGVVLAGTCLVLTAMCEQTTCVLEFVVGNRYGTDARSMVAPASEEGLFVADFPGMADAAGGSVAEAIRIAHRSLTTACFYGHCCPADIAGLVTEVAAERGVQFDLSLIYNDTGAFADDPVPQAESVTPAAEADARELLADSALVTDSTWEGQDCKLYIEAVPGADSCIIDLTADTAYLPPPEMEKLLRGVETLVLAAAYHDVALADIPAMLELESR